MRNTNPAATGGIKSVNLSEFNKKTARPPTKAKAVIIKYNKFGSNKIGYRFTPHFKHDPLL